MPPEPSVPENFKSLHSFDSCLQNCNENVTCLQGMLYILWSLKTRLVLLWHPHGMAGLMDGTHQDMGLYLLRSQLIK